MNGSNTLQNELQPWRIIVFAAILVAIFVAYLVRLFSLQILDSGKYLTAAEDNSTEVQNIQALRGVIYDRNGTILASNVASFNVVVTAARLPDDPGDVEEVFRQLSRLIGVPVSKGVIDSRTTPYVPCVSDHGIKQIAEYGATSYPFQPVKIKCDVDPETAMKVKEKAVDLPGIDIEVQPIRDYPTGEVTAGIVGFLGPIPASQEEDYKAKGLVPNRDKVGYAGVELQFQDLLAGHNGQQTLQVDVAGQTIQTIGVPVTAQAGLNLRLTIDTRLQQASEAIFKQELKSWNDYFGDIRYTSGVVIAINPKTGEILSMVSYPSYENNRMARFIPAYYYNQLVQDPSNPLLNHAVGDNLPAGSVFKLSTAVGALNEGVVTPDQVLEVPGKLTIQEKYSENQVGTPRDFVDWIYKTNPGGFGHLDFLGGISNSSNVYFYKLGGGYKDEVPKGLGICRLGTYARALGYGAVPDIGFPGEAKGLIPDPKWKRILYGEGWSLGDTYISSVGQGYVLATPLQVLMSAMTVANNGSLMQPTLVKDVVDGEGKVVNLWRDKDWNIYDHPVDGGIQISPFLPSQKWDITKDKVIQEYYDTTLQGCEPVEGQFKSVQPWVIQKVQEGMRLAVTKGTLSNEQTVGFQNLSIAAAGKTGTAEYCDKFAQAKNLCEYGNWPTHAWTIAYAPYENPEVAVVAFVYNGGEGSSVAGPIVRRVLQAYFELKAADNAQQAALP